MNQFGTSVAKGYCAWFQGCETSAMLWAQQYLVQQYVAGTLSVRTEYGFLSSDFELALGKSVILIGRSPFRKLYFTKLP